MILNWRGPWTAAATYQVGDVSFYVNASYVSLDINTNAAPIQANIGTHWDTFAVPGTGAGPQGAQGVSGTAGQSFVWRGAWNDTLTYNAYDCVSYTDGNSYICIASGVVNIAPNSNTNDWGLLVGTIGAQTIYHTSGSPPNPLPAPKAGSRAFVSDSTALTFGITYVGGGLLTAPVWSDGIDWYIG